MNRSYVDNNKKKNQKNILYRIKQFENQLVYLLPFLAIATYVEGVNQYAAGALTLFVLGTLALDGWITYHILPLNSRRAVVLCGGLVYILIGTIPLLQSGFGISDFLDPVRYAAVLGFLIFGAVDVIRARFQQFIDSVAFTSFLLVILAIPTLFIGTYHIGPIVAANYYPLRIGGVTIPTTSSIIWNTSYYGILMSLSFALTSGYGVSFLHGRKQHAILGGLLIIFSILARSRSSVILIGIFVFIMVVRKFSREAIARGYSKQEAAITTTKIIGSIGLVIVGVVLLYQPTRDLVTDLFLEKGLNNRGKLFQLGYQAWESQPLGYGFGEINEALPPDAPNQTVQNVFISYLVMGGVPLFSIGLLIYFGTSVMYVVRNIRSHTPLNFVGLLVCTTILWDGLWRTYIWGGIGFIPLIWTILSVSILVGGRNAEEL